MTTESPGHDWQAFDARITEIIDARLAEFREDFILDVRKIVRGTIRFWPLMGMGLGLGLVIGAVSAEIEGSHHEAKIVVGSMKEEQREIARAAGLTERMEGRIARYYLEGDESIGVQMMNKLAEIDESWRLHRDSRLQELAAAADRLGVSASSLYQRYAAPMPWLIGDVEVRVVPPPHSWAYRGAVIGFAIGLGFALLIAVFKEEES